MWRTTKERIKKAANRQKIEELNEVISNAEESLKQVQEEIEPLPNLTGEQVQHKKYGKGNVLECENGRMKIVFSEKVVTFQYPQAFVNGFLICNEMDETVLDIATDKVDSEVPSTAAGTITELFFNPATLNTEL